MEPKTNFDTREQLKNLCSIGKSKMNKIQFVLGSRANRKLNYLVTNHLIPPDYRGPTVKCRSEVF